MEDSDEYEFDDDPAILERLPWLETPLDLKTASIRILELHPGADDSHIICTLHVVSLDDHPEYEALSYVWGDSRKTKPITVGGATFNATENLFAFFSCLRHTSDSRFLWADAICIDQSNPLEKGSQIALMSRVYREAKEALIWFGPFTDSWTEEIKGDHGGYIPACELTPDQWRQTEEWCLEEITPFLRAGGNPQKMQKLPGSDESIMLRTLSVLDEVAAGKHFHEFPLIFALDDDESKSAGYAMNRHWLDIHDCERWLLTRPWWSRVWTLQEAVLPRVDPIVHVPPFSFRLSRLLYGRRSVMDHTNGCCKKTCRLFSVAYLRSLFTYEIRSDAIYQHRKKFAESEPPWISIEDAIDAARGRKSTVLKDHFFGTIGLLHPEIQEKWFEMFGYSNTTAETFSQCSKLIYDGTQSLLGLGEARGVQGSKISDLPSWVIDLSVGIPPGFDGNQRWALFNASLDSKFEGVDEWHKIAGRDLVVKAIPVGTIHACAERLSGREREVVDTRRGPDVILRHVSEWQQLYTDSKGSSNFDSFWRTAFMDRNIRLYFMHERRPLPASRLDDIKEWWANWKKTGDNRDTYIPRQYASEDYKLGDFHYRALKNNFEKHRFFCTKKGEAGMGPMEAQASDEIFVLQGCPAPAILRRRIGIDAEGDFVFVGFCYVADWMYGKGVRGRVEWQTLSLH